MKKLPYKTVWVEYPDIEALCEKLGAEPTNSVAKYTLPVIHDLSTNAVISDSINIARYLDSTYPSTTTLFPSSTNVLQEAFQSAFAMAALTNLNPILIPITCLKLNPASQPYARSTREIRFGKKLEDISPPGQKLEEYWKKTQEGFGVVHGWISKNGKGKQFVMGDTISYADVTIASFLRWARVILGEDSEEWKNIETWHDGRWSSLMAHFQKYEQVIV